MFGKWRKSRVEVAAADVKMVVGLGNPGSEFAGTRHNVGFDVVDLLAEKLGIEVRKKKFGARFGSGEFEGKKLILLKPQKFMNLSGQVVATAAGFYKLGLGDLIVVVDDMALEPGRIRIRGQGSAGGHNGLSDIISRLGSEEFVRCRIGIGSSDEEVGRDYVLSRPRGEDAEAIAEAIEKAAESVLYWLTDGIDAAMTKYNN